MQKYSLETKRTAHYYTLNNPKNCDTILIAIHGYAELVEQFINNFKDLEHSNTFVVCPEALSMFYGRERTPVASWMTSQHRIDEISDYTNYLNELINQIDLSKFKFIKLLGFSQGVSTLLRWFWQSNLKADLHLCCGSIPPELSKMKLLSSIEDCYYYYGSDDRLMKADAKDKAIKALENLSIPYKYVYFQGRHEIPSACIDRLKN